MKKITLALLLLLAVSLAHSQSASSNQKKPKYCILFIGDGFGVSAKTAARMAMGQGRPGKRYSNDHDFQVLALDKLNYTSMVTTHSANSWTTDSGPGASVYAAGEAGKIDNEAVSFDVQKGESVETILEAAKKEGYAVGIITTTRVTHATPAAFASHIWFRDLEDYIASQYISTSQAQYEEIYNNPASTIKPYNPTRDWQLPVPKRNVDVDVILGGGFRHFYPAGMSDTVKNRYGKPVYVSGNPVKLNGRRSDNVNLVALAKGRGYHYLNSRDALLSLDVSQFAPDNNKKLLGLFNASHMAYEQDRQLTNAWEPSLFEMCEMAIKVLKAKSKKGFFLMVEGGRIDHLEHANTGGIEVVAGSPKNQYVISADKPVYQGGGDAGYNATPMTPRVPGVYGSDYLIKEVLAFDYAVAQARKLMANNDENQTLIFSTSDHECGGTAIVGLHDAKDAQQNGTFIRTYALGPRQKGVDASSGGSATVTTIASPIRISRGDIDFGARSQSGWYPNYRTYKFQGRPELWPRVDTNGRRIVVAYASNPVTNGNGTNVGGTPGNHTPMDIWVGGDDNVGGRYASAIAGRGLLDNTSLTGIMADFLRLDYPFASLSQQYKMKALDSVNTSSALSLIEARSYPNPVRNEAIIEFGLQKDQQYTYELYDLNGKLVKSLNGYGRIGENRFTINTASVQNGIYITKLTIIDNGKQQSYGGKIIIQK
jgi:alkaline phosphatase